MLRSRVASIVLLVGVLGSTGIATAAAPAATAASNRITCQHVAGQFPGDFVFYGCDGNTGKRGQTSNSSIFNDSVTITWTNGDTTTVTTQPAKQRGDDCRSNATELQLRGTVTADTTGSTTVGHVLRANLCASKKHGTVTLAPNETLVL